MLIGAYDLHLYCDNHSAPTYPTEWTSWRNGKLMYQNHDRLWAYAGRSRQDALRQARVDGWTFRDDKHRCPWCTENKVSFDILVRSR